MSTHSFPPPHAIVGAPFVRDAMRLSKSCLTPDDVGLAISYWEMYPRFLAACEWLPENLKVFARRRLFSVYDAATWALMREAHKIGLDPYALQECGRLVKKLYWEDPKRAYHFREIDYDHWPDCMGAWRSKLPECEQAVLRNGVAVFTRLVLHWESAKAAPTESPLPIKRGGHTQPDPEGMTTPVLLGQAEAASSSPGGSETKEATQRQTQGGFLGGERLANALGIPRERRDAFFKQLERERLALGDDNWIESQNPRPNAPRYTYLVDNPRLQDLAKRYREPKSA